jgi:hypothetical protein
LRLSNTASSDRSSSAADSLFTYINTQHVAKQSPELLHRYYAITFTPQHNPLCLCPSLALYYYSVLLRSEGDI